MGKEITVDEVQALMDFMTEGESRKQGKCQRGCLMGKRDAMEYWRNKSKELDDELSGYRTQTEIDRSGWAMRAQTFLIFASCTAMELERTKEKAAV